jgi:competence protein ComGC
MVNDYMNYKEIMLIVFIILILIAFLIFVVIPKVSSQNKNISPRAYRVSEGQPLVNVDVLNYLNFKFIYEGSCYTNKLII